MKLPAKHFALAGAAIALSACTHSDPVNDEGAAMPEETTHIITVLQEDGWANTPKAVALIEEFAETNDVDVRFETVVIQNELDVQAYRYLGSPTIRINGLDVDPGARSQTQYGFGWRLMNWTQGASQTETMLRNAFVEAGWLAE